MASKDDYGVPPDCAVRCFFELLLFFVLFELLVVDDDMSAPPLALADTEVPLAAPAAVLVAELATVPAVLTAPFTAFAAPLVLALPLADMLADPD